MPVILALLGIALLGLLALQGWALLHVRSQGIRVQWRLDALGSRVRAAGPSESRQALAPAFDLPALAGGRVSLAALLAPAKPLLLVFTDPRCGPCYELLPDLGGWQRVYGDRLTIATISGGSAVDNRAMTAEYGLDLVLLQHEHEVAATYDVAMAPAAVVVRPDGFLSGPLVYGAPRVRELVARTLGLSLPPAPARDESPIEIGERVPPLRRPDLHGNVIDLAAPGRPTLLLFWSPGCHHCQELLPEIIEWEERRDTIQLVVVSRGPAALNQWAGLTAPIVLDDDRSLAMSFGVSGSPAAMVIDARGIVASPVARGAEATRALAAQVLAVAAPAA